MAESDSCRREFLSASVSVPVVVFAGCLSSEPDETSEYSCPDPFPVKLYNESDEDGSIMLEIRDSTDQVLFADTVELGANTGPYDGPELDVEIYDAQQYTFGVTGIDNSSISEEFEAKCGPVFAFITETGEPGIRDDELDHLQE